MPRRLALDHVEYYRLLSLGVSGGVAIRIVRGLQSHRYAGQRHPPREHGSPRGYAQHRKVGDVTCQECRDAHAADESARKSRRRTRSSR